MLDITHVTDPIVLQIASLFLLLNLVFLVSYAWRRSGFKRFWVPIKPNSFISMALLVLALSGVFTVLLGIERALTAFCLGFGMVLSLLHPILAVSFFLTNLVLRTWELMPPNILMKVLPRTLAAVCMLSWFLYCWRKNSFRIVWNESCAVYTVLLLWLLVSSVLSGTALEGVPYLFSAFLPSTVLALLILNTATDDFDLNALSGSVVTAVAGIITVSIYITVSDPKFAPGLLRLSGPGQMGNPNDLAALIALAFPLMFFPIFMRQAAFKTKVLGGFYTAIFLTGLWISQSRGAILSLLVCGVTYLVFCRKGVRQALLYALLILVIPVVLFKAIHRQADDIEESGTSRLNYAITGLKMVKRSPIWGVGIGNYPKRYKEFTNVFLEEGERTAHSSWVLVMSEAGLAGLGIFTLLFLTILRRAWSVRVTRPEFLLALVSYGVAMSFLSHSWLFFPYLLFALVLAAAKIHEVVGTDVPPVAEKTKRAAGKSVLAEAG